MSSKNAKAAKGLNYKLRSITSIITRFNSFLETINAENFDIFEIEARLSKVKGLWDEFHSIQAQIAELSEDDVAETEDFVFEEQYFKSVTRAEKLLASQSIQPISQSKMNQDIKGQPHDIQSQVRLPQISLPSFSGIFEEWIPFYETFNSLIHSNESLSNVQKFHYLKSCLKDDAANCIQELQISINNYEIAWGTLKERFDNKRVIIRKHIQAIHELPNCTYESLPFIRQILDGVQKHTRALKSLERPVEHWDDWLVYVVTSKMDKVSIKEWESKINAGQIPTFNDLLTFLSHKCTTLEIMSKNTPNQIAYTKPSKGHKSSVSHISYLERQCTVCKGSHFIHQCQKFLNMSAENRAREVKVAKLCYNCLRGGHQVNKCNATHCKKCTKRHNTLLHVADMKITQPQANRSSDSSTSQESTNTVSANTSTIHEYPQVLLSTAIIKIADSTGKFHQCRILLDSGSQSNFISSGLVEKLKLKGRSINMPVTGIGQLHTQISKLVSVTIKSNYSEYSASLNCLVLDNITSDIPSNVIKKQYINIPHNLNLADPEFNRPRKVDLLIGAELFWQLLCVGQIKLANTQIIMQKTRLGWIISGALHNKSLLPNNICNLATEQNLDTQLTKFWEIEENSNQCRYSQEDLACEKHFVNNHIRNHEGRFVVSLPFKEDPRVKLGDSKEVAIKRFYALERKLLKQPEIKEQYVSFMNEYVRLEHMKLVQNEASPQDNAFYLPHHAVINEGSLTTKLRVVFDASAKSTSGHSLNDLLMVGPSVQEDLFSITCRFRTHKIVLTADITKMYRQILLNQSETCYQRIIWRADPTHELQTYELNTVTYGTAPASFLATRTLKQLAVEDGDLFPLGAKIAKRDFYVDDLITGSDDLNEIKSIFCEINSLLQRAGFELRKWASNDTHLLNTLLPNATEPTVLNLDKGGTIKTLGLQWNSASDKLEYTIPQFDFTRPITKRSILSTVAQVFDPLGLIGPVIAKLKMLMQTLWQLKISWDETVPLHLHTEWIHLQRNLSHLRSASITRNAIPFKEMVELHGFCDASQKAYGACIYVRSSNEQGQIISTLLCSKSKVAPLKITTIPRLELCAALLLAQLMHKVTKILELNINRVVYWTDSTIVLAWINTTAKQLKTFVANRVGEIQEITDPSHWRHIRTKENPADLLSRGAAPEDLLHEELWWQGPKWLLFPGEYWPQNVDTGEVEVPEKRNITIISNISTVNVDIFERYSTFIKLQRVVSYCKRFVHNLKCRVTKTPELFQKGPLTTAEIDVATKNLVGLVQAEVFSEELRLLKVGKAVQSTSKLLNLHPFVDADSLIRVGGRLQNAQCHYDKKHPIILPSKHVFTKLLIEYIHRSELHAGTQATLATIRSKYWILAGRNTVRTVIKRCITCFKAKPVPHQPVMGNLPSTRVEPARPFINTGVDFCGPFLLRSSRRRRVAPEKGYIAIFVCMAVKAVHIELVTSLHAEAFINALKRFIARRGMVANIYSDNGMNFVKANKDLDDLRKMFSEKNEVDKITSELATQGISWHFIPPRAPHFGGLWEAAVKSFKYHFKRVVGNALLTYEEFVTVSVQIEAILNSRPITPLSEDPDDISVLTPGHFLIGDSLRCNLEPNLSHLKEGHLNRFQLVERLKQHFWQRWSKEYLHQLQERRKWTKSTGTTPQVGQLVILKEDNIPPMLWPLGRVLQVHPGKDDVVRAVTVKTVRGEFNRPANRLCILPIISE